MEQQVKTPVQIVQELLALHATRLEAAERLKNKVAEEDATILTDAHQQSEKFTGELMNELSNYGDAALSGVAHDSDYQKEWTAAIGGIDTMDAQQALNIFRSMEKTLATIYTQYTQEETNLPATLQKLLTRQASEV